MKKTIVLLILIAAFAVIASSCGEATTISVAEAVFEVTDVKTAKEFNNEALPEGSKYLIIQVEAAESFIPAIQDAFFPIEGEPCSITSDGAEYKCSFIAYSQSGLNIVARLVFEVPSDFPKTFTLSGNGFSPVGLKY